MLLPTQSQPVDRNIGVIMSLECSSQGIGPLACTAVNTGQGSCYSLDGPIPGSFNCAACCAFRIANHWQGDNGTVAVC